MLAYLGCLISPPNNIFQICNSCTFWLIQAQEYEILDLNPFFSSSHFKDNNFILDDVRGVITHPVAAEDF